MYSMVAIGLMRWLQLGAYVLSNHVDVGPGLAAARPAQRLARPARRLHRRHNHDGSSIPLPDDADTSYPR